jgi:hypothetical protein
MTIQQNTGTGTGTFYKKGNSNILLRQQTKVNNVDADLFQLVTCTAVSITPL